MPTLPTRLPPIKRQKALTAWLNELRDFVETLKPSFSNTIRGRHTSIGVSYDVQVPAPSTTSKDFSFKGEYSPLIAYDVGDMVKLSSGLAAGSYICLVTILMIPGLDAEGIPTLVADPTTYPWLGTYWVLIGRTVDQSNWI